MTLCIRILALFDVLDPGPVNTQRNVVLFLTSNAAGMATNAPVMIDDKTIAHETTMMGLERKNK
jgi:hypothetical protein